MTAKTQAVVLAAGEGYRLGKLTAHRSKAMLPILGQPLVGWVLDRLRAAGLRRLIVVGAPHDAELIAYLKHQRLRMEPDDVLELVFQPEKRGTADALTWAAPYLDRPFVLVACDNLVESSYLAQLSGELVRSGADGVLGLVPMTPEQMQHSAAVDLAPDGHVRRIVEKPPADLITGRLGSIFVYALGLRLLDHLDVPPSTRGEREIQAAIQALIDAGGDVRSLIAPGRLTLTRPADLLTINLAFLDQGLRDGVWGRLPPDVTVVPPVRIEAGVQVETGCHLGPRLYLERGCRIGAGAWLHDAVVLRDGVVAPGEVVAERVVAG